MNDFTNDVMDELIAGLAEQLMRLPTEDEVIVFIFGTNEQRQHILARPYN